MTDAQSDLGNDTESDAGIVTERLTLVPLSRDLVAAQLERSPRFFDALGAEVRGDWPPPLYDDDAMRWLLERLGEGGDPAWHLYAMVTQDATVAPPRRVVGVAGFKGAPDARGEVEIGYSVAPVEQRRGYAQESVAGLLAFAFADPRVRLVSAHTLYIGAYAPSRRVLDKSGFEGPTPTDEQDLVRYEITRDAYESRRRV